MQTLFKVGRSAVSVKKTQFGIPVHATITSMGNDKQAGHCSLGLCQQWLSHKGEKFSMEQLVVRLGAYATNRA